ncbi:MAG: metal-dependent transcriptional regulator [Bernardetiaceae bacterium]|nr:metal-dependent transcriptional regulator [Bernardetiaceae bacterium]
MELSFAEENYLKTIYHLSLQEGSPVATNSIAAAMQTKPASVSDMLKRLARKQVINYVKYYGVSLTESGQHTALWLIRKHRLWEVFLVEKLKFSWDQVHEVAEQLEHIRSGLLIERLDEFLGYPKYDPHGDPIPNKDGKIDNRPKQPLSELEAKAVCQVAGVRDTSPLFLQYLDKVGIYIGAKIYIKDKVSYDLSLEICIDKTKERFISHNVADNLLVLVDE